MTSAAGAASHNTRIKLAFQIALHLPFWALFLLGQSAIGDMEPPREDASRTWAMLTGVAVILFGLIAAGLGLSAGFLEESEEADDLRHERRALLLGAGALVCSGFSLIVMSHAGPGHFMAPHVAVPLALGLTVVATILVAIRWQRLDELNRAAAREAGYLAFLCISWIGGTWAMLSHTGYATGPAPLDWLTMMHGFSFIAGLASIARRGGFVQPAAPGEATRATTSRR